MEHVLAELGEPVTVDYVRLEHQRDRLTALVT